MSTTAHATLSTIHFAGARARLAPRASLARLAPSALAALATLLVSCKFPGDGSSISIGTKALWIANGTDIVEYLPGQLGSGTKATAPHLTLKSAVFGSPQGVTLDAGGNLWVLDPSGVVNGVATPALFEFSTSQLAALASDDAPTPFATITSTSMKYPQQAVFDSQGSLWVTDHDSNALLVFTPGQLGEAGAHAMTPAVLATSTSFNGPLGIAFDSSGNLWVSNDGGAPDSAGAASSAADTIVQFKAATLPAAPLAGAVTSHLVATVTLSDDGSASIQAPWALAFDVNGNLWSSNSATPSSVVEFAQQSLTGTGAPKAFAVISPTTVNGDETIAAPRGICFDDAHNLAVMNSAGSFSVALFAQSQLKTGATAPATFLVGSGTGLSAPAGCTFGPAVN